MKESIYTIPISEVFEPKCGCPLCALAATLEDRWVQYITGAAMMEPDVRLKTNEEGFCARHLTAMLGQRNRLSVALLLQTRLDHLLAHLGPKPAAGRGFGKKKPETAETCFVCGRVGNELRRLAGNLVTVWAREESFRALYAEQEYLCVPHYRALAAEGETLRGENRRLFQETTLMLVKKGLTPAKADIDAFCKLFDYRSGAEGKPSEQVSSAVEKACAILCGDGFGQA